MWRHKKVEIYLNDTIGTGRTQNQRGDGAGLLFGTIRPYYREWNPSASENSAVGVGISFSNTEQTYGSNARAAGGYSVSHIRATLIGKDSKTNISYAGDENLNETNSLYNCLPSNLKSVITAKKVKYVTGTSINSYSINDDIADKIWAFSQREMYGTARYSGYAVEGLGDDGNGYSKFSNSDSKYYISSYNDNAVAQRVCYSETNNTYYWWLRSPVLDYRYYVMSVQGEGYFTSSYGTPRSYSAIGLAFGFCIK